MARWNRVVSVLGTRPILIGAGALYLLLGAGEALRSTAAGNPGFEALSPLVLIGLPGFLILYGGNRLPEMDIQPGTYPRIVVWALAGFGLLLGIVALRVLSPAVTIDEVFWSAILATALGTVAGLAIGIKEARAISRAQIAEQRSQELEQTKAELEDTVDHLQTANERLEQFAYAASHDLQEPLRMVSSYLQMIENRYEDDLDEDGREFLSFAVDGADRMRDMIDGLLAYSRVESQGEPLEPVDLNDVLADVLENLQMIEGYDAEIMAEDLPRVEGDAGQVHQLLQHLLQNAIEYSGDDPPRIHISAELAATRLDAERRAGKENPDHWVVSVADEGIGIAPKDADRIFEVFQSLGSGDEHGSGIGLALCKRIVERHGGEIWVESEPVEGATFSFTLPASGDTDE